MGEVEVEEEQMEEEKEEEEEEGGMREGGGGERAGLLLLLTQIACQSSEMFTCHYQQLNIIFPPFHFSLSLFSFCLPLPPSFFSSSSARLFEVAATGSQTAANYLRTEAFLT